ncbi:MAG: rhomboid family intramembrane serine protease [Niabella sp.]|nr:rhomboid family intramembrane serine protease [Niabella sp.]
MGISDRNYDNRLSFGTRVNPLVILIAISMILFVILAFFRALTYLRFEEGADVAGYFNEHILSTIALSPKLSTALAKTWTFLTYSFVQVNVWDLIANMLWLWCFGFIFIDITGNKKLIPLFIYSTVLSGLVYVLVCKSMHPETHAFPYFSGSGACILAIAAAATTISPNYKLLPMLNGGISLWIITLIYTVIDFATIPPGVPALYFSQLTGALTGFLFIYLLRKGYDGSEWMNRLYDWFINLFNPEKSENRKKIKDTYFYKTSAEPFTKTARLTQQRLDAILDKMNQSGGYEMLTQEEKDFLNRASQEDFRSK